MMPNSCGSCAKTANAFSDPTFADPPCAICKAADRIESLSAVKARVEALCDEYRELPGFADIIRMFRAALAERGANDKHE